MAVWKYFALFAIGLPSNDNIMDREKLFEEFINECEKHNQWCGIGNPFSQILLVGQELYIPKDTQYDLNQILDVNYKYCKGLLGNNDLSKFIKPRGEEKDGKFKKNTTWCNYQTLIGKITGKKSSVDGMLDFEQFAFTTELSSIPKTSSKFINSREKALVLGRVSERLKLFSESEFIKKSFPVVILACGGYLRNQGEGEDRQIDNTFDVRYGNKNGELDGKYTNDSKKKWFYTHYSTDPQKTRLVIHTGQVSQYDGKLWDKMAEIIREHLRKLGLL